MLRIFGLFYKEIQKCRCRRKFRTRQILLSFDDGPDPLYTDRLLELLKREEVPAVFFVVAEKAARYPQIIEHILADGHRIEYHGADHRHFGEGPHRHQGGGLPRYRAGASPSARSLSFLLSPAVRNADAGVSRRSPRARAEALLLELYGAGLASEQHSLRYV